MPRKPKPLSAAPSPAEALAANLRHLRRERFPGWGGQRRFAGFLDISPNDLCVYEYGRALPNEQRLEEMAGRLEIPAESLLRLLPGVSPSLVPSRSAVDSPAEAGRRLEVEELRLEAARLEAKVEILQGQLERREDRIRELEEANLAFRSLAYLKDTPEAAERRRQLLERLESSLAAAIGGGGVF